MRAVSDIYQRRLRNGLAGIECSMTTPLEKRKMSLEVPQESLNELWFASMVPGVLRTN
jgi:hypothetical protein